MQDKIEICGFANNFLNIVARQQSMKERCDKLNIIKMKKKVYSAL